MNLDKILNHRTKAFATVLLVVGLSYFVIRPIALNTYTKYLQVLKYQQDIQKMKQNLKSLDAMERINKDYKDEIKLIDKIIPEKADEKSFIKDLSILCGKNKVSLVQTEFKYLRDSVTFNIQVDGSYANIPTLLKDIKNMLRLTSIEKLTVTSITDDPVSGNVKVNLTGRIFKKAEI